MADNHHIVLCLVQLSPRLVCNGNIVQDLARLERKFGYDSRGLVDQGRVARRGSRGNLESCLCECQSVVSLVVVHNIE